MQRKTMLKIFIPVGTAALIGGGIGIGYGIFKPKAKEQTEPIEGGEVDITISGNAIYGTWKFSLKDSLAEGQYLKNDLEDTPYFNFTKVKDYDTVSNKIATVYVLRTDKTDDLNESFTQTFNPTFTCYNKDGTVAWKKQVKDCKVTYAPFITFDTTGSKETIVEEISEDMKHMTFTYKFKLQEELREIGGEKLVLTCWVTNLDDNQWKVTSNTTTVNEKDVTVELTVFKQKSNISIGDYIEPNLQFECTLGTSTWWQSNIFKGFKVSYDYKEVATTVDDLTFVPDGNYVRLTGIKSTANEAINTLVIPSITEVPKIRYVGNKVGDSWVALANMGGIKKIKFSGLGVMGIMDNAFYNLSEIRCIDVSAIPDTVRSLDSMTMGSNSFAGLSQTGRLIWNNDFSQYKRHLLKEKLYHAGLTHSEWFGIIKISNLDQLRENASTGGYLQLQNDLTISNNDYTGQVDFTTSSILDLNGYNITCTKPIYNTNEAQSAIIGVWNCELVVADTSDTERSSGRGAHGGGIYACEQKDGDKDLSQIPHPTDGISTQFWENTGTVAEPVWHARETRCFYVRSDVPTKTSAKGTLEILGGKYYGNCTNIFTYNTVCYIENGYDKDGQTPVYAPEFHIYTPFFDTEKPGSAQGRERSPWPAREMLNCKESTFNAGYAYFDVYGGKFFGIKDDYAGAGKTVPARDLYAESGWDIYDPMYGWGDTYVNKDGKYTRRDDPEQKPAEWTVPETHPNYLDDRRYKGEWLDVYFYTTSITKTTDGVPVPYITITQNLKPVTP